MFLASNLALHCAEQKATVLPSLPTLLWLGSIGLPSLGHLAAAARPADANVRAMTVSSVFIG